MGFDVVVAGPADKGFNVEWSVVKECEEILANSPGGCVCLSVCLSVCVCVCVCV